jgi:hypothetical protein
VIVAVIEYETDNVRVSELERVLVGLRVDVNVVVGEHVTLGDRVVVGLMDAVCDGVNDNVFDRVEEEVGV